MQICNAYQLVGNSFFSLDSRHSDVSVFLRRYCTIRTKKNGHITVSVFI